MTPTKSLALGIITVAILSGCSSNKSRKEYLNDWKFTENIDQNKIVTPDTETGKLFDILTSKTTGITFNNELIETFDLNYYRYGYSYNGGGVGVGDINNDSLPDLYFTGNVVPDRIYLNKGNLQFEDITDKSGINGKAGWSTGVTFVDINEDGWEDIYVCRARYEDKEMRRNLLYINNGDNTFTERAKEYGLDDDSFSTHGNFFDADNDGDLDLYIVTHPTDFKDKNKQKNFQKIEEGTNMSNKFYRNEGNGKFVECHAEVGINNHGFGLSATAGDINDDGWQDVFVGNDYIMHDYTYINQGDGKFKEMSRELLSKTSYYGMGTDVADYNNDGLLDMVTVDMDIEGNYGTKTFMQSNKQTFLRTLINGGYLQQYGRNALQLNNGFGKFSEVANFAGVSTTGWSWTPLFTDFDNDGYKDLYISNGFLKDSHMDIMEVYIKLTRANRLSDSTEYYELRKQIPNSSVLEWPKAIFRNNGDLTFEDVREEWGLYFPAPSYGAAYADLDRDGDEDIIVSNSNKEAFICRNNATKLTNNKYLRIKLEGEKANPDGLGAKIYVTTGSSTQYIQMAAVKGYLSCSEPIAHFGLGAAEKADKVVVRWLDGKENVLENVAPNQEISISHKNAVKAEKSAVPMQKKLFADVTNNLNIDFEHKENSFDDFDREFLIPHELSNLGPGIAVGDVNGDGLDDFFIGGAKGQSGAIYTQTGTGSFVKAAFTAGAEDIQSEDMGSLLFDADGDNDLDLYVVSGGSDFPKDDRHLQDRLYINDGKGNFNWAKDAIPSELISSGSCIAAQDYDKDGDMDLFVGGRLIPGDYPYPTASFILQNNKGKFTNVTKSVAPELGEIGMVCSALWTDINNDGDYDLVMTGEWMPITVFENNGGKFKNITASAGLSESTGWWNSLASGDFDNDGDVDYIAGNFGINLKYRPKEKPIELFYDDYDNDGRHDIIMAYWQQDKLYPIKTRERMIEQMKDIETIFPNWDTYGRAEVWDFYGRKRMENSKLHYKANSFYTSYIENLGNNKFAVRKLPNEAQISSVFGIVPMDVNNDGNLDIVCHGNFYETEIETNTQDAAIGLVLIGNGDGTFAPMHSRYSGFYSPLNAKSLALINVGSSKKPTLLAGNSNSALQAFSLETINSIVMLASNDQYAEITMTDGKKRRMEFQTGSGYLSQNAKSLVITDMMAQVMVFDSKGNSRIVYGGQILTSK